jgi:hemerythrin
MPVIEWTEEMSVGVAALDDDHRALIALIHRLDRPDVDVIGMFHKLVAYVDDHFEREEAHLAAIGYSGIETHRGQHAAFAARLGEMLQSYLRQPFPPGDRRLSIAVSDWLRTHILVEDRKYAGWTKAQHTL